MKLVLTARFFKKNYKKELKAKGLIFNLIHSQFIDLI
jgi:hypothetical protein